MVSSDVKLLQYQGVAILSEILSRVEQNQNHDHGTQPDGIIGVHPALIAVVSGKKRAHGDTGDGQAEKQAAAPDGAAHETAIGFIQQRQSLVLVSDTELSIGAASFHVDVQGHSATAVHEDDYQKKEDQRGELEVLSARKQTFLQMDHEDRASQDRDLKRSRRSRQKT